MKQLAEITVQKVWPPGEGKKWGNVVSAEGAKYFGPPALCNQFAPGEVAKLEWEPFGTDGTGKKIVRKIFNGAAATPKQFTRPSTSSRDSEQIFVTALLKEYIAAGMVALDTGTIVEATKKIRAAYAMTFGGVQAQSRDDMDDEIPF
jgi:hypothetical protein